MKLAPHIVLALALLCGIAHARPTPPVAQKTARFVRSDGQVTMTVGFRELFDARLRRRLRSGFATTVTMRIYLYRGARPQPVMAVARRLSAVYDLWDEQFILRVEDPAGRHARRLRAIDDVIDRLSSFWRFPLVSAARLTKGERYFAAVVVEVNPMSPEVLAAVRRWLRKPTRRQVDGESLFGSFVSIFVNDKIRRAERTFKFRTQDFFLP